VEDRWHVERGGVDVGGEGYEQVGMVSGRVSGGQVLSRERRSAGGGMAVSGGGLEYFGGGVGGK
jgi:hypothetical protein